MKRLFIEPLDVFMFRSERPFIARESHIAKLGLILPQTFEGAIKSKIFSDFCLQKNYSLSDFQRKKRKNETVDDIEKSLNELRKIVEEKIKNDSMLKRMLEIVGYTPLNLKSRFNVLGVFFSKKEKEYFPVPNDIVKENKKNGDIVKVKFLEELKVLISPKYSKVKPIDGYIDLKGLKKYLYGGVPEIKEKPYTKEIRVGIKLDKVKKQTIEGHLYAAEFLRLLENWGFVLWYNGDIDDFVKDCDLIRLGGEGRGAIFRKIEDINIEDELDLKGIIKKINEDGKFKLYLAAPSYFGGYKPDEKVLENKLEIKDLKMVACLPGKPIYVGGYDFAKNLEKSLRRWVNAGAVYYYKFKGKIKEDIDIPIRILNNNIDMRCAFIGRW